MERIVYFDLETKYSADEVGGWNHIEDMGMSVGVIWDSHDERFHVYLDGLVKTQTAPFADRLRCWGVPAGKSRNCSKIQEHRS